MPHIKKITARLRRSKRDAGPLVSEKKNVALVRRVHGKRFPTWTQLRQIPRVLSRNERIAFHTALAGLALGILWFGITAAGGYRTPVPDVGGRYMEAVVGTPQRINPIFAPVNEVDMDVARLVYSGLMKMDETHGPTPDLAASYEVSEDKKTYTFRLRDNVVWHDGESFTANDVVFTFSSIQDPDVGSPLLITFQGVVVEKVDDYTVRFTLKEPFAPFLSSLTVGILPKHIWVEIAAERMRLAGGNLQPVGTGPFVFQKLVKDEKGFVRRIELARFERYYEKPPFLEEFALRFYQSYEGPDGAIQALREQKVDGLNFVPYDLRDKVQRKHIALHTLQLPQYTALFFNQTRQPLLEDATVRTALATVLDKERIVLESLEKEGQVISSPVLPGFPGYRPEIEKTAFSVEKANELLDGAKWERIPADTFRAERRTELFRQALADAGITTTTPEGEMLSASTTDQIAGIEADIDARLNKELHQAQTFYRKNKDGEVLHLSLVTADTAEYTQAAQLIEGFWEQIGVQVTITYIPPKDMVGKALKGRQYDVLLYGMILGADPDQYPFWHSTQKDFPGLNLARYVNREVDTVLQKARESVNPDEEVQLYQQFQDIILKERPAIFLYMPTYTYATTDRVLGITVVRISHPSDRFSDVTNWYVETKGQWQWKKAE